MVDLHMVSIAAAPRVGTIGNCYSAAGRCKNGRALRGRNIRAIVIGQFPREGVLPVPEI